MKTALVLHGRNCKPEMFWYPYIAKELEKIGYEVSVPLLPEHTSGDREIWVPFILESFNFQEESTLIAVSASVAVLLEVIESLDHPVKKVILVAGFITPLGESKSHPAIKDNYDWDKIKRNIGELYIINSDIDPYGANDVKGREIFEKLGGTQIIPHNQGHFGSIKFNQPYKEFPLLKKLIQD